MSDTIDHLSAEYDLIHCVECGKCVASCPMPELFADFSHLTSPRGVIEKALLGFDVVEDEGIWFCLTCDVCTDICPAGVRFRDFIERIRLLAIERGITMHGLRCQKCGQYFLPVHTMAYLQDRLGGAEAANDYLALCPRCRRYEFGLRIKEVMPRGRVRR